MIRTALVGALTGTVLALSAATASAVTFGPPINDNYLDSLSLNAPHTRLDPTQTLEDFRNTTTATTQALLYTGRPEPTTCNGASYGKTIWYDFYPHVDGLMSIRANMAGGDPVIGISQFSPLTAHLQGSFLCNNDPPPSGFQQFVVEVARGRAYTVQIGGVNNSGGLLSMQFDFLEHKVGANATLKAAATPNGIKVLNLIVKTSKRARVAVSCPHRRCHRRVKGRTRRASFRNIGSIRAGSRLEIRVTSGGYVGRYLAFKVTRGNFTRLRDRCLLPGSSRPRRSC